MPHVLADLFQLVQDFLAFQPTMLLEFPETGHNLRVEPRHPALDAGAVLLEVPFIHLPPLQRQQPCPQPQEGHDKGGNEDDERDGDTHDPISQRRVSSQQKKLSD